MKSPLKRRIQSSVQNWDPSQVGEWLRHVGIPDPAAAHLVSSGLNGQLLLTWYDLLHEAPNVFFQSARQDLSLDLIATLRLVRSLRGMIDSSTGIH